MAVEVFNRYESKYLLDERQLSGFQSRLAEYMEPDSFNREQPTYPVANLYYDTPDSLLIRTSLQKPVYKEKLRLRAYAQPAPFSQTYVEIKKKVAGLVNKRRSPITLEGAYAFLHSGRLPQNTDGMNRQVLQEIACMLQRLPLQPMMYLSYERRAYFGIGREDVRISFDTNLRARGDDLRLELGSYGEPLLPDGTWLMEVKVARSMPVWLARLLSDHALCPISYSKYGAAYKSQLERRCAAIVCACKRVAAPAARQPVESL